MIIHILQHGSFESPGNIIDWIKEKKLPFSYTKFYEKYRLSEIDNFDWLIIMGGPMGVYDEEKFPWLKEEKAFIKKSIDSGKIVLGICLGAQLIAASLGAKVYPNKFKEIGWFNVNIFNNPKNKLFPSSISGNKKVFQWHGDTFDLPAGAIHIAESEACKNQAFIIKDRVLALQFHCEITKDSLKEMIRVGKNELKEDKYVQSADEIMSQKDLIYQNNSLMRIVLNNLGSLSYKET